MPTYQYACTECSHSFETVQSFSDDALTECPQCHGRLRKLFHAVGVVFKGSGFYRTDSRAANGASRDDAGKSGSGPDGKPDPRSDSKPEAKPDTKPATERESKPKSEPSKAPAAAGSSAR